MLRVSSEMVSPCSCTAVSSPCLWYAEIFTDSESRYLTRSDFMAVLSLTVVTGGTFCNVDIILVFFLFWGNLSRMGANAILSGSP